MQPQPRHLANQPAQQSASVKLLLWPPCCRSGLAGISAYSIELACDEGDAPEACGNITRPDRAGVGVLHCRQYRQQRGPDRCARRINHL